MRSDVPIEGLPRQPRKSFLDCQFRYSINQLEANPTSSVRLCNEQIL